MTGVQIGSTVYEPTEGVVDISPAIPDTSELATKTEVTQGLAGKVDKETGKGLSTNDYTTTDKTKLANIESGAQVNVINGIKANGASETLPVENGIVTLPPAASPISPATSAPLEDGTAGVGSSEKYAREDHVHPHDMSGRLILESKPKARRVIARLPMQVRWSARLSMTLILVAVASSCPLRWAKSSRRRLPR